MAFLSPSTHPIVETTSLCLQEHSDTTTLPSRRRPPAPTVLSSTKPSLSFSVYVQKPELSSVAHRTTASQNQFFSLVRIESPTHVIHKAVFSALEKVYPLKKLTCSESQKTESTHTFWSYTASNALEIEKITASVQDAVRSFEGIVTVARPISLDGTSARFLSTEEEISLRLASLTL